MDYTNHKTQRNFRSRSQWRFGNITVVIMYILLFIQQTCVADNIESSTKNDTLVDLELVNKDCHSCQSSSNNTENDNLYLNDKNAIINENSNNDKEESYLIGDVLEKLNEFSEKYSIVNRSIRFLERKVENLLDKVLRKDSFVIIDGIEIRPSNDGKNKKDNKKVDIAESRALFSKYTYEYRLYQKIKNFINTHMVTINLPKAAQFIAFRCKYCFKYF